MLAAASSLFLLGVAALSVFVLRKTRAATEYQIKHEFIYLETHLWEMLDRAYGTDQQERPKLKIESKSYEMRGLKSWYDDNTRTIHVARNGSPSFTPAFLAAVHLHKAYRSSLGLPAFYEHSRGKVERAKGHAIEMSALRHLFDVEREYQDMMARGEDYLPCR